MTGPRPASEAWTPDDDRKLLAMSEAKMHITLMARKLKRTVGAVQSRRAKLRRLAQCLELPPPSSMRGLETAGPAIDDGWSSNRRTR